MPTRDELTALDATAQAALVRSGEISPGELVERAIERIERLNPGHRAERDELPRANAPDPPKP
jgi:Asp-tRNA(Asn)/Glu-tRNA(Gln) amidotransferase A subunit family amidase